MIHVLFEDDAIPKWEQEAEVKSKLREHIYGEMYGIEYKYAVKSSQNGASASGTMSMPNLDDDLPPPVELQRKPYVPPTNPEDLPGILDAPMGEG